MTDNNGRPDLAPDVAIIHRYFWPQNYPYAVMLRYIAEGMSDRGISVGVYSSHEPGTDQAKQRYEWAEANGIHTRSLAMKSERNFSVWRKAVAASIYALWVFYVALTCGARVIWVGTTPPLVMVSVLRFARLFRKFKIVYHCQDIHPEALALNGNIRNPTLLRFLKKVDSANIRSSSAVVTLSKDMRDTIAARPCDTENVSIINNFIIEDIPPLNEQVTRQRAGPPQLLFAGSLGRFQNLEFLAEVIIRLAKDHGVETTFMGDGPLRPAIERSVKDACVSDKVTFTGHRPLSEAIEAMQKADFGLISLTEGVDRVAYPSKTVMYLATGLPCVAFVNPGSSVGSMIHRERLGIAADPENVDVAVEKLAQFLATDRNEVRSKAEIAGFARSEFSRDVVVRKLADLTVELTK